MAIVSANGAAAPLSPNYVINSAFDFWQRGTSFTSINAWTADRWIPVSNGSGGAWATSRQTFTPGSEILPGYNSQYFLRHQQTTGSTGATYNVLGTRLEDVRTLAGTTVTLSFYAKSSAPLSVATYNIQRFGSGGSSEVLWGTVNHSITTSWQRFTATYTLPSVAGKTIGDGSYLLLEFGFPNNATFTFDVWGVQLEAGSVATPFRRNANSIQGELAACKRYLPSVNAGSAYMGYAYTTNSTVISVPFDVQARKNPTGIIYPTINGSTFTLRNNTNGDTSISSLTFDHGGVNGISLLAGGSISSGVACRLIINASGYILFDGCEL